jgi:hypothetical protein
MCWLVVLNTHLFVDVVLRPRSLTCDVAVDSCKAYAVLNGRIVSVSLTDYSLQSFQLSIICQIPWLLVTHQFFTSYVHLIVMTDLTSVGFKISFNVIVDCLRWWLSSGDSRDYSTNTLVYSVCFCLHTAGSMWYSNRSDVVIQSSPTILHSVDTSNTNSSKHFSGSGTSSGPRYCRHSSDCGDTQLGQTCYWLYDGCNVGRCMCDPKRHTQQASGKCTQC